VWAAAFGVLAVYYALRFLFEVRAVLVAVLFGVLAGLVFVYPMNLLARVNAARRSLRQAQAPARRVSRVRPRRRQRRRAHVVLHRSAAHVAKSPCVEPR
jgi:hypothetical protein